MSARLNYFQQSPTAVKHLTDLTLGVKSTLDASLVDLINIRASQLNGCAFCVDMHVKEARIHGERDLRVHHVAIWRESPLFTEKERAALEWTEAVTRLSDKGISDEIFEQARSQFSEKELTDLTFAISAINAWNRISVAFRPVPGSADKLYGLDRAGLK
ncbi:MAG: carboxymuconolactone decarboxylase family protein [Bdellovibrionia bacterium]